MKLLKDKELVLAVVLIVIGMFMFGKFKNEPKESTKQDKGESISYRMYSDDDVLDIADDLLEQAKTIDPTVTLAGVTYDEETEQYSFMFKGEHCWMINYVDVR